VTWVLANLNLVWGLMLTHAALSVPPIVLSFLISIPLGWLANRHHLSRGVLLTIGGLLYTIPSLPLFIFLPTITGTNIVDPINVEIALTIYGVALMLRTTADGLASVDPDIIQSATAMGYSRWQRFWRVEFPLSGPVLLAGLRVVSVSTVSLLTVGSVIGVTSLGYLFLNGYQRNIPEEVFTGIVATVIIALVFDTILVLLGRLLMPWSVRERSRQMRVRRAAVLVGEQ
jgi:osmoprotectant transport system permease protein